VRARPRASRVSPRGIRRRPGRHWMRIARVASRYRPRRTSLRSVCRRIAEVRSSRTRSGSPSSSQSCTCSLPSSPSSSSSDGEVGYVPGWRSAPAWPVRRRLGRLRPGSSALSVNRIGSGPRQWRPDFDARLGHFHVAERRTNGTGFT
jgi:hypothetical protein